MSNKIIINRPEKVGKAKRTLPSAKQMVLQGKINKLDVNNSI
jgi:hypothetical protein